MTNFKSLKPVLLLVSILAFIVSLIFTIKLLTAQATTGADKTLFTGLAFATEIGKVVLFSLGMMLLFVMKKRSYSWLGAPLLLISLAFTILSIIGTLGALQVSNMEKTEKSIIASDKYNLLKEQIAGLTMQANAYRAKANEMPPNYYTKKQEALDKALATETEKEKLLKELQNLKIEDAGSQNALYVALANWTGDSTENVKFKVMASYGIGLEALALFCALFAFFGDYLFDKNPPQQPIERYYENAFPNTEFHKQIINIPQMETPTPPPQIGVKSSSELDFMPVYAIEYIINAYRGENSPLRDKGAVAEDLEIGKEKIVAAAKFLEKYKLIKTIDKKTYPLHTKEKIIQAINSIVGKTYNK